MRFQTYEGKINAPEFPSGLDWINTDKPLKLSDLKGKIVLLDFWTYGCINCYHIIPDLHKLEAEFPNELVVIGVHSAKFSNERNTENIRRITQRYGITHPVVNDSRFQIWDSYTVNAWPTVVLIDPLGKILGYQAGEGIYEILQPIINGMIGEFQGRSLLNSTPITFSPAEAQQATPLLYPGKVLADPVGGRLIISDTNHNRLIIADLTTYQIIAVIGSGDQGFSDGDYLAATFNYPQGIAINGDTLYVADTGNHAIREIDLKTAAVKTIAGTGQQNTTYDQYTGRALDVALNSPWDLVYVNGTLYIAMAGPHQLWRLEVAQGLIQPHAGSGAEGLHDDLLLDAQLAQPSGIATDGKVLYFTDPESSSVRIADIDPAGWVHTIIGEGLFDFGDVDGSGSTVRLQHPLGITVGGAGELYIVDTYNSKIKVIDPTAKSSQTLFGSSAGYQDGNMASAQFNEPGGISYATGKLYIADTNNNLIRVADLSSGEVTTVEFPNADILLGDSVSDDGGETVDTSTPDPDFFGDVVAVDPIEVAPGTTRLNLNFTFPEGYKVNNQAPFTLLVYNTSNVAHVADADNSLQIVEPTMPVTMPITLNVGESTLTMDATVVYCEAVNPDLCYFSNYRFEVPLKVSEGASAAEIKIDYTIKLPESPGSSIGN
ncbi:MAG: redoxin domain-containing protein [Anaerolineae bacterium]|nr:redoxin domain-containing protein [Anaerolineae bacterium]